MKEKESLKSEHETILRELKDAHKKKISDMDAKIIEKVTENSTFREHYEINVQEEVNRVMLLA